ncbi:hypothetical protein P7K49_029886 [Saguinus oedipus]|uniref:Uncharacterized protein n=1 Tax=Saguinus oedipus TaxID=9490 RepID=A0ABQ9U8G5_SAGOE|nr:hypothetical protein P7K49_029886 [Saguinus oedipus]
MHPAEAAEEEVKSGSGPPVTHRRHTELPWGREPRSSFGAPRTWGLGAERLLPSACCLLRRSRGEEAKPEGRPSTRVPAPPGFRFHAALCFPFPAALRFPFPAVTSLRPRVSFPRRSRGRGRPPGAPMAFARRLLRGRLSGPRVGRREVCSGAMAPPRCFVLELPDCSLAHFALRADAPGHADAPDPRLVALLGPPVRSYSLCVPVTPGAGCGARVRAARLHHRLFHQLRRGPFQWCQLLRLLCYCPGGQAGGAQHGFLLRDPQDDPNTRRALLELLGACQEAPRPHLGEFEADPPGQLWQRLWEMQDGRRLQVGCARVVPTPEPPLHPVVPDLASSVVFPDREVARAVLEEVRVLSLSSAQRGLGTLQTRELDQEADL